MGSVRVFFPETGFCGVACVRDETDPQGSVSEDLFMADGSLASAPKHWYGRRELV